MPVQLFTLTVKLICETDVVRHHLHILGAPKRFRTCPGGWSWISKAAPNLNLLKSSVSLDFSLCLSQQNTSQQVMIID